MHGAARRHLVLLAAVFTLLTAVFGAQSAVAQSDVDDPAEVAAGMAVFESNCVGCHSADGSGSATGRPLIGIAAEADRSVHIESITNGKGNMPAWGDRLSAEEISAAASYVRLTFVAQEAEAELAVTGASTTELAIVGLSMIMAGGLIFVLLGRRENLGPTV